ncbi:Galactoside 2-alpha-L-fucosyltransferase [Dichanthelium oligosanthes]|uniref:Fucosyltransferase n=1 Tax=Dichanthelium oligosanthes TaxID=888268 RepID=A0A1E5V419_9POAL|nr:Galactoside 2-alpha-L-fucosyltransferase [Dichanthelium oligosanthes]
MKNVLTAHGGKGWNWGSSALLTAFVMTMPTLVILFGAGGGTGTPAAWVRTAMASLRQGPDDFSALYTRTTHDKLHGGLLVEGFGQESCHSRYESAMYRRSPGRRPSEHLVSKLRRHEALQRRCGPGTAAYSDAIEQIKSGKNAASSPECKYLVSISYRGLGNRILAAASAFLYALLTDRVLLVEPRNEMDVLFCEPFPNTTWLLPPDFPFWSFSMDTPERYGKMREDGVFRTDATTGSPAAAADMPAFAYIHLDYNQTDHDQLFFCDEDQRLLSNFQWVVMRTDSYIVPGLFLVETFQRELGLLFPERDAVFHHLGRYLFHPTNHVWGLVTRYYHAHLAWAQRRVGIQVRVFPWEPESPELLDRITKCTQEEGLLPRVVDTAEEPAATATTRRGVKSSAVLITSLKAWYYEQIKGMYWENATADGEVVVVSQPSHEEYQHYGVKSHEYKAWAEIYLLSLTDMLVTSGKSTFGYVAQGLAGIRPWVLLNQANGTAGHKRPCSRDISLEPCFHVAPLYNCKRRQDSGEILPHVRHCEDVPTGLKLVDRKEW